MAHEELNVNVRSDGTASHFYMVTFEIAPEDEKDFNEIYDTEHIPNILQVEGVLQVIRMRDAETTPRGWLKYSALYLITQPDLPATPQWKAKSDLGRWAPVIRPKVKARRQRLGTIAANMCKAWCAIPESTGTVCRMRSENEAAIVKTINNKWCTDTGAAAPCT